MPSIAIVIPAFNEAEALPRVLAEIPARFGARVVVVDNASDDGTGDVARAHGAEAVLETRRGYGSACLAGIAHVADSPPDVLVILDADHSDYPEDLELLVSPIFEDNADLVCGSRVERAGSGVLGPHVRWGNRLATGMIWLLFGHRYQDMGPFRALRWRSLVQLEMSDPAYGWNAEMQVKALQRGLRVLEVPVRYRTRVGRSKISGTLRGTIGAGSGILMMIARLRLAHGGSLVSEAST